MKNDEQNDALLTQEELTAVNLSMQVFKKQVKQDDQESESEEKKDLLNSFNEIEKTSEKLILMKNLETALNIELRRVLRYLRELDKTSFRKLMTKNVQKDFCELIFSKVKFTWLFEN